MKKQWITGLIFVFALGTQAETVTNNLDVSGGFIYNHGAVNPGDIGMTFTNEGIRDITVSAGQLSGVDPETGTVITNAANLLPLKAQSLTTASNIVAGGSFVGNGAGLTNLNVNALSGTIGTASLPTSGVWNAAGVTITNANLAGNVTVSSLTVATNLTVQGIISGDGSGLTGVTAGAGGSDGSFQFNNNGVLSGDTNFFIHPTEHKPAFRSPSGNFFRGYNSENISDNNLIYSVRNENGVSVLRLRENGQDTIRLSGDGTAYIRGHLQLDGQLIADGSGLTNLPVQAQVDALIAAVSNSPAATITTNQIASWNSGGALAASVQVSTGTVNITTNLTVQGVINGDGSGLTNLTVDTDGDGMPDWYENQHHGQVIFEDHFDDGTLDSAWVMKRTYWEEADGKLKTVPEVLPDFNYGHWGNGRGSLIVLHEGDTNWVDYSCEFTCAGVGVVSELNPHYLPLGLIGDLSCSFRAQEAPASWNEPAETTYNFSMVLSEWEGTDWTNGNWKFSAVSNVYIPGSDYYGMTVDGGMAATLSTETEKISSYEGVMTGSTNDLMMSSLYASKDALVSGEDLMTLSSETGTGWSPYYEGVRADLTNGNSSAIKPGTQENHVRVVVKGTQMYVWVNEVFLGEADDPSGMATYGGIALHGGAWEAMAWYDDVVVRSVGLDPNVPDADLDYDNDGVTNLEEYQRDTDPMAVDTVDWSELTGIPADLADGHVAWNELTGTPELNASYITGTLSVASLPTSGVWNASGVTVTNATLAGNVTVSSLTVATNLTVQGTISGNGSGLTGVTAGAGGNNGELQFNENGTLAGNTNIFMHPTEHKLAFRSQSGNIFRAYNSETISDSNLIYSLRNEDGTSVLRLRQNGQDTVRLSGDGTAYIKGNLQLDGQLIADGSGLTNLPVQMQVDALIAAVSNSPAAGISPTDIGHWNTAYATSGTNAAGISALSSNLGILTSEVSDHASLITNLESQVTSALLLDGSRPMQASLDMGGHSITNISTNSLVYANGQTVRQTYVDAAGDTMTGVLTLQTNLLAQGQIIVGSAEFAQQTISNAVTGALIVEGIIRGDGSELTQLNATNLVGTISTNNLPGGGTASSIGWGNITGTLTNQTDLADALAGKLDTTWTNGFQALETDPVFTNWLATTEIVTSVVSNTADVAEHASRITDLETQATGTLLLDGSRPMQASLDMGGHSITNISTNSLVYADGQSVGQKYVDVAGDTMTGALTLQTNLLAQGQIIVGSAEFAQQTISNAVTGALVIEGTIRGDGSGLTQLNATNLVGTISTNNLPPEALLFSGGVATNVMWGQISGTLSAQTDLSAAFSGKADSSVLSNVVTNLTVHIAETNNPHQVTAAQVGAYTILEADMAISNAVAAVGVSPEGLSMNGVINMNTNRITNISDPVDSQDAVTKAYLEYMLSHLTLTPQGDISMGAFTD